jgi:hypothetical protein
MKSNLLGKNVGYPVELHATAAAICPVNPELNAPY